jgi:hypothetical protein
VSGARTCLVVTSIAGPTDTLRALAASAAANDFEFVLVGDAASPARLDLEGCDFYGLARQRRLPFELAALCPTQHYARKNIGYLLAMRRGAATIVETDDDTVAYESFWRERSRSQLVREAGGRTWVNAYRYFSRRAIWPRGFPLDEAQAVPPPRNGSRTLAEVSSPIQQGLIDDDPDVDAVYRLLFSLPLRFDVKPGVALAAGSWCPFNSQNTTWWPEAYPLMYLPATCSFRMTDIWRSFVAQRIAWENGWRIVYHGATIRQARNAHDLMRDLRDELTGYLENKPICEALARLELVPGADAIAANMRAAYGALVAGGWLAETELPLLEAWLADVAAFTAPSRAVAAA